MQQRVRALEQAIHTVGELKRAHGIALTRLREARAQWDFYWAVLQKLILGAFDFAGRRHEVESAFEPIRLRGSARLNSKAPLDPTRE